MQEKEIRMKKLLSLALALIMMVSAAVYLPLGISATETEATTETETIYSENFDALPDGTYTAQQLADALGWTLLRGTPGAEVASVENGLLTLSAEQTTDLVYQIATDAKLMDNFTLQYDLTMVGAGYNLALDDYKLFMSAVYTGTYDKTTGTTRAVFPKCTYEGFNHMVLADGNIDEQNLWGSGYAIWGTGNEQIRPANIPFGGGLGKTTTKTSYKVVYDWDNNQVDCYAGGVRFQSTASNAAFDNYTLADYAGKNAYVRVQKALIAELDNISLMTGGDAKLPNGNVVFEENFDDIEFDPETETAEDLQVKTGFYGFTVAQGEDPSEKDELGKTIPVSSTYSIVDGKLDILNPYKAATVEPKLYIPEMEKAETVVVEFDQQMVYFDILGEYDRGDQAVEFQMYGINDSNRIWLRYTQKGFATMKFYVGSTNVTVGQIRPQTINYQNIVSGHKYTDWTDSHYNLYQSCDHHKFVFSLDGGVEWYINGALTMFLNESQLEKWDGDKIMGHLLKFFIPAGCHVQYDNFKVSVDPEEVPELLITEAASSAFGNSDFEYVEIYNNASEPVNVYDYCLINQTIADSMKSANKTAPADVIMVYPGAHTYRSIATNQSTGESLYSVTHTNPAYEEGWLQPGEVAVLWNTANAMHSGTSAKPEANKKAWSYTVDDFRKGTYVPEDVKVFLAYNDYNRTLEDSGRYVLAMAERSIYQPDYQPKFGRGDMALAEVLNSYENFTSYVYMLIDGPFDPADNRSDYGDNMSKNEDGESVYPSDSQSCYRDFYSDSLSLKNGAPETLLAAQFEYIMNNRAKEGRCINYDNIETRFDVSPGVVYDRQKRVVSYSVDQYTYEKYLGMQVFYDIVDTQNDAVRDGKKTLFSFVNGTITFDADMSLRLTGDTQVNRVGAQLFTLSGAALNLADASSPALRWTTVIKTSDFEELLAYQTIGVIRQLEVGTLVAKTEDLTDGVELTIESAADSSVITKVDARVENWLDGTTLFRNEYAVLAAEYAVDSENYGTEYSAVGYISATLLDGRVITIYGSYDEAAHSRSVLGVASAIREADYAGYDSTAVDSILATVEP